MSFQESKALDQIQETNGVFQKLRRSFETRTGKVGATVAIVMGSLSLSACAGDSAPEHTPTSVESEAPTSTPTETETPAAEYPENNMGGYENDAAITEANAEQRIAEMQFTADMTPDQISERYNEITDGWAFAGATPETWYAWYEAGAPDAETFAAEIAKKNTPAYATALFGANYASGTDQPILDHIKGMETTNAREITYFLRTYGDKDFPNTNTKNLEAWHYESTVLETEVASQSDEELSLIIEKETNSNSDKNMYFDNVSWNGKLTDTYITLRASDENPDVKVVTGLAIKPLN